MREQPEGKLARIEPARRRGREVDALVDDVRNAELPFEPRDLAYRGQDVLEQRAAEASGVGDDEVCAFDERAGAGEVDAGRARIKDAVRGALTENPPPVLETPQVE